ncbi:MAG: arginine deiminase family protein [Bacteroidota bacterium]
MQNYVANELGKIKKILIHSPDSGIGKIIPSKFKEWLYDDTVHLQKMREEYNEYIQLLLYFIDPEKAVVVKKHLEQNTDETYFDVFKPDNQSYFDSDKVIDVQKALSDILEQDLVKIRLVSAICAIEGCNQEIQQQLEALAPKNLAKALITGILPDGYKESFIFPPVPNLVFTRDIGITIKDHVLLSKSATQARKRDSLIAKYIYFYHPLLFANTPEKIIEISEDSDFFLEDEAVQKEKTISIEGGDVMMIAPNHLIVGCSERTTQSAADAIIHKIFSLDSLGIEKVSVVQIPAVRAQMHIDTIFTQIKRNAWVMYGGYSEAIEQERQNTKRDYTTIFKGETAQAKNDRLRVFQFYKPKGTPYRQGQNYFYKEFPSLEDLLVNVSTEDFGMPASSVKIIYSAAKEFPYDQREQWTDSCNLLALQEGLVVGYDRNDKTIEAFADSKNGLGFTIVHAKTLLPQLKAGAINIQDLTDTLILLSSSELSRARGGSHCMSNALLRDDLA